MLSSTTHNAGPHRGIPNTLAEYNNHTAQLFSLPTTDEAVSYYIAAGGHLSSTTQFGTDPLSISLGLSQQRQEEMEQSIPSPEEIIAYTVNGEYTVFAHSLRFMIDSTFQLQS